MCEHDDLQVNVDVDGAEHRDAASNKEPECSKANERRERGSNANGLIQGIWARRPK